MSCDNLGTDINKCDPKVKEMKSAKEVCQAVEKKSNMILDAAKLIKSINPYTSIIDSLTSKAGSDQTLRNIINVELDQKSFQDANQECNNITTQIQSNTITGTSPECIDAFGKLTSFLPAADRAAYMDKLTAGGTVEGVTQENIANAISDCTTKAVLTALQSQTASVDNLAVQRAINESKGLMASATSNQDTCNNISTKMTSCSYAKSNNCCLNSINQKQSNALDIGCGFKSYKDIIQKNSQTAYATCSLTSESNLSQSLASSIVNKSDQSADNKATGLTVDFLLIILIIIVLIFASPFLLIKAMGNVVYVFMGILLGCIAGYYIYLYVDSKAVSETLNNIPYIKYKQTSIKTKENTTYSKAKEHVDKNSDILGVDFFIDKTIEPQNIVLDTQDTSGTNGLAVYLKSIGDDKEFSSPEPDLSQNNCVSYRKDYANNMYLYIGAPCALLGCLFILIGIVKLLKSNPDPSTKTPENTTVPS